ncbi:hypothetical protein MIF8_33 [Erwinia phage MIF8]
MHRYIRVPEIYRKGDYKFIEEEDTLLTTTITKLLLTSGTAILCVPLLNANELKQPHIIHSNIVMTSMGTLNFTYHEKHNQVLVRKMGDSSNG